VWHVVPLLFFVLFFFFYFHVENLWNIILIHS
jgi:hypothetical protein